MAVVKMKKVYLVGPEDRRKWAVERLQDLGIVHIEPLVEEVPEPTEQVSRLNTLKRVQSGLMRFVKEPTNEVPEGLSDEQVCERAEKALARLAELDTRIAALKKELDQAAPWGKVGLRDLEELESAGLFVRVYAIPEKALESVSFPDEAARVVRDFPARRGHVAVALLSVGRPVELDFEAVPPLPGGREEHTAILAELDKERNGLLEELAGLAKLAKAVDRELKRTQDALAFARTVESVRKEHELFALQGWCPAETLKQLTETLTPTVALLAADPADDEDPPVELKNGPFFRLFEPMIKMFTLPHYREGDPTVLVAPFMTLFFGLCLGDGGYGLIITLAAVWAELKFRPKGDGLKVVRFMEVLGLSTLIIGVLTGTVFGISIFNLKLVRDMGLNENSLLFFMSSHPDKFFYASLGIGLFQVTFGFLVKLKRQLARREFQGALATIGWLLVAPGAGVWVLYGSPWLFVAAVALIFFFSNPTASIFRRLGSGAWELYNISGLFGDVMSYARLFGLGLSTGIIGNVVNQISLKVMHSGIVGWVGGLVILLVGHSFNLSMSAIGAMVHSARLQFLEFYGKFFEGEGRPYRPLKRLQQD